MQTKTNESIRALRRILGQTQGEFAAMIGASKDTVASWETGRNPVSATMARRIALATGVEERSLQKGGKQLLTRHPYPRREFTAEEFQRHRKSFWGQSDEECVRRHLVRCEDALELLLRAAVKAGGGEAPTRLPGVLDAFSQWCQQTREDFQLGEQIEAQLARRTDRLELNHRYAQWREMAKRDPDVARKFGFKDDPKRGDEEMLRLSLETVPLWKPGYNMRGGRRS